MVAYNGPAVIAGFGSPAWTAWTPTVTSTGGTITTATGAGRYFQWGKILFYTAVLTITTNGTGVTAVQFTLPLSLLAFNAQIGVGRATTTSGKQLQVLHANGSNVGVVTNYDNTYPAVSGETLTVSGVIETQ